MAAGKPGGCAAARGAAVGLRELGPRVLDLADFNRPAIKLAEVLALSDNYGPTRSPAPEGLPKFVGRGLIEPLWRQAQGAFLGLRCDRLSGPYLAD